MHQDEVIRSLCHHACNVPILWHVRKVMIEAGLSGALRSTDIRAAYEVAFTITVSLQSPSCRWAIEGRKRIFVAVPKMLLRQLSGLTAASLQDLTWTGLDLELGACHAVSARLSLQLCCGHAEPHAWSMPNAPLAPARWSLQLYCGLAEPPFIVCHRSICTPG